MLCSHILLQHVLKNKRTRKMTSPYIHLLTIIMYFIIRLVATVYSSISSAK